MSSFSAIKNNILRFKNKKPTKLTLTKQNETDLSKATDLNTPSFDMNMMNPIVEPHRRTATVTPRKLPVNKRPQVY